MKKNRTIFFSLIPIILTIIMIASILLGPVDISLKNILHIILDGLGFSYDTDQQNQLYKAVLINIRIPRILLSLIVGIGLGTAGAILQGLFRNPLVDPGFIGVSSGAAIGALIVIIFSHQFSYLLNDNLVPYILPITAMIGSIITTLLVFKISIVSKKTNVMIMLLSGIAINALVGAIIGLLIIQSNDQQLRSFTFWTLGGFDNANWQIVLISGFLIGTSLFFIYPISKKLDIFMLGDSESTYLGLNVENLKRRIILITALIVGVSVAFCGMIGFIGLVTPHLVRLFIGPEHKYLLPGSSLLGGLILTFSDLISRTIIAPAQLPVGIITSLMGAPFFIWLLINQKRRLKYAI